MSQQMLKKLQGLACLGRAPSMLSAFLPAIGRARSRTLTTDSVVMDMKPYDFVRLMKKNSLKRCFVVYDKSSKSVKTSNHLFSDLKVFCEGDHIDFKEHEGFFLEIGRRTGALMGAFVWRTDRGQAVCFRLIHLCPLMTALLAIGKVIFCAEPTF